MRIINNKYKPIRPIILYLVSEYWCVLICHVISRWGKFDG